MMWYSFDEILSEEWRTKCFKYMEKEKEKEDARSYWFGKGHLSNRRRPGTVQNMNEILRVSNEEGKLQSKKSK